jgi:transcriptional regulator with XRE-family HTH domain
MLPKRLKEVRRERGIRQEEISQYLGVKRQTYSAYERGVSVPDSLTLKKLADYFDVSIETFFHDPETDDSLILQEQQLLLLARKANKIPKSQRVRLIKNFEENIVLYLEAIGIREED